MLVPEEELTAIVLAALPLDSVSNVAARRLDVVFGVWLKSLSQEERERIETHLTSKRVALDT